MSRFHRFRLIAILFCIGTTWGLTIPLTKIAVSTGHQPFGLILWELLLASLGLGAYLLACGQLFSITGRRVFLFVVIGLAGTVIPGAFSYRAAAELPAGVMALVIALVPLCSLPIAILIKLERPDLKRFIGVICGAIAIVLIVGPENALPDPAKAGFVLLALIAPFCYAVEGNFVSWRGTDGLNAIETLFGASVCAFFLTLPLTAATGEWVNLWQIWGKAEWALVLLSVLHIGAYAAYIWLVGQAGAVFASQVAYLVTVSGVLWSIALLDEGYSKWIWAALATLILGISLVLPKPRMRLGDGSVS